MYHVIRDICNSIRDIKAFHINQLRLWNDRVETVGAAIFVTSDVANNEEDKFFPTIHKW